MDAPLVMSAVLNPTEIDDEAQNLDSVERYPLEFYEAAMCLEHPSTVSVKLARDDIEKGKLYADLLHTHDTSDIASGPRLSAYKTLGPMLDKLDAGHGEYHKLKNWMVESANIMFDDSNFSFNANPQSLSKVVRATLELSSRRSLR